MTFYFCSWNGHRRDFEHVFWTKAHLSTHAKKPTEFWSPWKKKKLSGRSTFYDSFHQSWQFHSDGVDVYVPVIWELCFCKIKINEPMNWRKRFIWNGIGCAIKSNYYRFIIGLRCQTIDSENVHQSMKMVAKRKKNNNQMEFQMQCESFEKIKRFLQ